MRGFKGFDKGLVCRGKQYSENTVFEEENAEICKSGMHFCANPFDVWEFYSPCGNNGELNEFAEVEALDEAKTNDDTKFCTSKLRIGKKLTFIDFVKAGVNIILNNINIKIKKNLVATNTGNCSTAINEGSYSIATSTGDYSVATNTDYYSVATNTGDYSAATNMRSHSVATNTGDHSAATNTGDYSAAINMGSCSAATNMGDYSVATIMGNYSAAINEGSYSIATSTGDSSVAMNTGIHSTATNAGCCSAAINEGSYSIATNTGNCSTVTSAGDYSAGINAGNYSTAIATGKSSIVMTTGYKSKVKGVKGSWIICAEHDKLHNILCVKAAKVDGEKIKENVFYTVKNGEFVEVTKNK